MFEEIIEKTTKWAVSEGLIEAAIIVGSYARGTRKPDSDIDLILITSNKQHYINNTSVFSFLGEIDCATIEQYGECTSVRVWYQAGFEVEYGMVSQKWIEVPLDIGTKEVLGNGYRVLLDKTDLLTHITSMIPEYRT